MRAGISVLPIVLLVVVSVQAQKDPPPTVLDGSPPKSRWNAGDRFDGPYSPFAPGQRLRNSAHCRRFGNCGAQGQIGYYRGGRRSTGFNRRGFQGSASAGGDFGAFAQGSASNRCRKGKGCTQRLDANALIGAEGRLSGSIRRGPFSNSATVDGQVGAGANLDSVTRENWRKGQFWTSDSAGAFAGARGGASDTFGIKGLGSITGKYNVGAGIGAQASFSAGRKGCRFSASAGASAYLGVGGGGSVSESVNPCAAEKRVVKDVKRDAKIIDQDVKRDAPKVERWTGNAVRNTRRWTGNAAKNVRNAVGKAWNGARSWAGNAGSSVGKAASGAWNKVHELGNRIASRAKHTVSSAASTARKWGGRAVSAGKSIASRAKHTVSSAASTARKLGGRAASAGKSIASRARSTVSGAASTAGRAASAGKSIASRARSTVSGAASTARKLGGRAASAGKSIASRAKRTVSSAASTARKLGGRAASAASSAASRAKSAVSSAASTAKSATSGAWNKVKSF